MSTLEVIPEGRYTVLQAAAYLGISRGTITRWTKRTGASRLPFEDNVMNGRKVIRGVHLIRIKNNLNPNLGTSDMTPGAWLRMRKEERKAQSVGRM